MVVVSFCLISFLSYLLVLIIFIHQATCSTFLQNICVDKQGNYTTNSTYHTNLNTLLSSLASNTQINYGFYNSAYGQNADKVNAIGLCRGDVNTEGCRSCLNDSIVLLPQLCSNRKEAIVWYDECMLRYSNRSILSVMETRPWFSMSNGNNITEVDRFYRGLNDLLDRLRKRAASGDSRRKYAAGNETGISLQPLFGLVQCTPDLSQKECSDCLATSIPELRNCCDHKIGARVVGPSCSVRYETYSFYQPVAGAPPSPTPSRPPTLSTNNTASSEGKSNTSGLAVAIVVPVVVVVVIVVALIVSYIYLRVLRKPRKKFETENDDDDDDDDCDDEIETAKSLQFQFDTIRVATNDFLDSNKLGQGGFGTVYWGKLYDGRKIAVKRLSMASGQGNTEFKNEVSLVAKLQHQNLVRLLGFCLRRRERLLVYEFVTNKSLDYFIFDPTKKAQLSWERRYKIIGGVAGGLLYLHEDSRLRIIHRDLKASNILLDEEMNPKISDFGMARLLDQTHGNSTRRIVGTYGYMAPEYAMHGQFSVKSDVFSFGVLILEIVSGQKNHRINYDGEDVEDLVNFAWRNWSQGTATNIIDPILNDASRTEIMRCIHIALLCVQEKVATRPTMAAVVLMLNSYSMTLPLPHEPTYFIDSKSHPYMPSLEYDSTTIRSKESTSYFTDQSVDEASITEPYPR